MLGSRSAHEHGKWVYVDGEARVTWDDGWQDVIRKVRLQLPEVRIQSGPIGHRYAGQRR